MKKIIAFLVGGMVWGVSNLAFAQGFETFFIDVPIAHENYEAIDWLAKQGVIQGYSDGTFGPDKPVNRVEFLKMVYTIEGLQDKVFLTELEDGVFGDVDLAAWYAPYVMYARKVGTVEGYPDGNFRPDAPVNRAEALKIGLLEFYGGNMPDPGVVDLPYLDTQDFGAWYYDYVTFADSRCLVDREHVRDVADEGLYFDLDGDMTRKEVAEFLYRLKSMIDNLKADQCDEEFIEDPNDVEVASAGAIFEKPGLFYADYEHTTGWKYWGNINMKVSAKNKDNTAFSLQSDEFGRSEFWLSDDGKKLASFLSSESVGKSVLFVSNFDGTLRFRVFEGGVQDAIWSPDGKSLLWSAWGTDEESGVGGNFIHRYDVGSGPGKGYAVKVSDTQNLRFVDWIGDRVYVIRTLDGTEDSGDFGYFRFVDGELDGQFNLLFKNEITSDFNFSFDKSGGELVYSGNSREGFDVKGPYYLYMRNISVPGNEVKLMESEKPFVEPILSADGKYLFYENGGVVWRMELATREVVQILDVEVVNEFAGGNNSVEPLFVSGDGKKLIVMVAAEGEGVDPVNRVYMVNATSDNEFIRVEDVYVDKGFLNKDDVFWVE